ncbi:MAG: CHAT domain-containing protein [Phycisphaerae bacterium]|nr:CHAT domain-containing protein [Phycisphaerae bacterium]
MKKICQTIIAIIFVCGTVSAQSIAKTAVTDNNDKVLTQTYKNKLEQEAEVFYSLALEFDKKEKYNKSIILWNKYLELTKKLHQGNDHKDLAMAHMYLAQSLFAFRNYTESLFHYDSAFEMALRLNPKANLSLTLYYNKLVTQFENLNLYEYSLHCHKKSLDLLLIHYSNQGNLDIANSYNNIGNCLCNLKRGPEALSYYQKSRNMYLKLYPNKQHLDIAKVDSNIASCFCSLGKLSKSIPYYKEAIEVNLQLGNKDYRRIIILCDDLAHNLMSLNQLSEALFYQKKALTLQMQAYPSQYQNSIAVRNNEIAQCLFDLDRYSEALPHYKKSLAILLDIYPRQDDENVANCYANLAICQRSLKQYHEAVSNFEKSLKIYSNLYPNRNNSNLAIINIDIAKCLKSLGQLNRALSYYEEALEVSLKINLKHDCNDIATNHFRVASCLYQLGKFSKALPHYEKTLEIRLRIYNNKDHQEIADSYFYLSHCLYSLKKIPESIFYSNKALQMRLRLYPKQNHEDIAYSYNNHATYLLAIGRFPEALAEFKKALKILQDILSGKDDPIVATSYDNLGICLVHLDRAPEAISYVTKALNMRKRLYPNLKHDDIALSYNNLASALNSSGRPVDALTYYEKALTLHQELYPDQNHSKIATGFNNVACCLTYAGRHSEAINYFRKALEVRLKLPVQDGLMLAKEYDNLACCLERFEEKVEESLVFHKKALAIILNLYPQEDHPNKAVFYDNIGKCYLVLKKPNEAILYQKKALSMFLRLYPHKNHKDIIVSYINLASSYFFIYEPTKSIEMLELASYVLFRCVNNNFSYCNEIQKKQYLSKLDLKLIQYRIYNLIFQSPKKLNLSFADKHNIGFAGALLTKNILSDAQQKEQLIFSNELPDKLKEKYRKYLVLKKQYATLAMHQTDQMVLETDISNISPVVINDLQKQIDELEQELRAEIPEFAQKVRLKEISVQDVHKALKPGHVLLEYVKYQVMDKNDPNDITLTDESNYAVFILEGGTDTIEAYDLGAAKPLDTLLKNCKKLIKEQGSNIHPAVILSLREKKQSQKDLVEAISKIKSQVLPPKVFDHIKNANRLYIAPTSALMQFPFEILPITSGKLDYMVNKYEMIYLNTSRDLVRLHLSSSNQQKVANREMCIIGNPNFNLLLDKYKKIASTIETPIPTPSQHAQAEIEDIFPDTKIMLASGGEGFHPSQKTDWRSFGYQLEAIKKIKCDLNNIYWGDNAVEEAFYANTDSRIINFATHGYYWENAPEGTNPLLRSMLVFAGINTYNTEMKNNPKFDPKINDCYLTAYEISGLDLSSTEFVNLVACQTGLGSDDDYQGVIGLRSSFILAGARSLSVSMWEVPAESSAIQMQNFYDLWLGENPKTRYKAFRQAQINALNKKETSHPFFWAGFVYVGDPGD